MEMMESERYKCALDMATAYQLRILNTIFHPDVRHSLERLRLTTSTANVYGKATRSRTRNRRRFLVKIVRATCRPYGVLTWVKARPILIMK